jgi:hypothetical protein
MILTTSLMSVSNVLIAECFWFHIFVPVLITVGWDIVPR